MLNSWRIIKRISSNSFSVGVAHFMNGSKFFFFWPHTHPASVRKTPLSIYGWMPDSCITNWILANNNIPGPNPPNSSCHPEITPRCEESPRGWMLLDKGAKERGYHRLEWLHSLHERLSSQSVEHHAFAFPYIVYSIPIYRTLYKIYTINALV